MKSGQPCSPAKSKPLVKVGRKATGPVMGDRSHSPRLDRRVAMGISRIEWIRLQG